MHKTVKIGPRSARTKGRLEDHVADTALGVDEMAAQAEVLAVGLMSCMRFPGST